MARILICHVPKDGSVARDLGSALMARGHFVSFDGEPDAPRADRASRLRQFEAVVVVWTEASHQSAGLSYIAREALPLNLLIPVRSDKLDLGRLPLVFRKLNMFSPRDFDGLARLIARLSTAASQLKAMAEQAAKFDTEPRREPPPVVPRPPNKTIAPPPTAPPLPVPPPAMRAQPAAARPSPFAEAVISAAHAQYTARTPAHLGLPDVTDPADMEPGPTLSVPHPLVPPPLAPRVAMPPKAVNGHASNGHNALNGHKPANGHKRFEPAPAVEMRPAPPPPLPPPPEQTSPYSAIADAQDLSQAIEAGLLLHYIPETMWLGEAGTVEVRLNRDVLYRFFGADMRDAGGSVIETLSLSLYGSGEAFEIERLSERTQPISRRSSAGENADRWTWLVTPHSAGTQDLVVRLSALMLDRHGVPAPVALPDRRFRVEVEARGDARVMSSLPGWIRR